MFKLFINLNNYFHQHLNLRIFTTKILPDLDSNLIRIIKNNNPPTKLENKELKFGATFTAHILEIDWSNSEGWLQPVIKPFQNFNLHPAVSCLHYGLQAFEGMKAYKDALGQIRLFRPEKNMERLNNSCKSLCFPTFSGKEFLDCIKQLIRLDEDYIPTEKGYSLYIRPTIISTHQTLGVSPPHNIKLFVICCPVGPYYPTGFAPVKLYANSKNIRAWPGGVGDVKVGGNYGPTIRPQLEAATQQCQQVLWLFGKDLQITEVGTMNQFFVWKNKDGVNEVVTAPLDGTILPGITRDSMLNILREEGKYKVTERIYTLNEVLEALLEDRIYEAFGSGTAAIVSPVKGIVYKDKEYKIPLDKNNPNAESGPLTKHLFEKLLSIQYGEIDHPWSKII